MCSGNQISLGSRHVYCVCKWVNLLRALHTHIHTTRIHTAHPPTNPQPHRPHHLNVSIDSGDHRPGQRPFLDYQLLSLHPDPHSQQEPGIRQGSPDKSARKTTLPQHLDCLIASESRMHTCLIFCCIHLPLEKRKECEFT